MDQHLNLDLPATEEVKEFILAVDRGIKAVKLYPANNPNYQALTARAISQVLLFFDRHTELCLSVGSFDFLHEGELVYRNEDRAASFPFALFKDGIRQLIFRRGITAEEILAFLNAFNRDFTKEYLDDDLVTCFWERDFKHISFVAVEDFLDEYLPDEITAAENRDQALVDKGNLSKIGPGDIKEMVSRGSFGAQGPATGVPLRQAILRPDLLTVSDEVRERVAALIRDDAAREYDPLLVDVLQNILRDENDPGAIADLVALLGRLVDYDLSRGQLARVMGILRRLSSLNDRDVTYPPRVSEELRLLWGRFSKAEFIENILGEVLQKRPDLNPDEVCDLVMLLKPAAIPHLLNLFEKIEHIRMRKALCRGLAALAADNINLVAQGLEDHRWYVARNAVFVLGMIHREEVLPYLRKALRHPNARVRREVARVALSMPFPGVDSFIMATFDDADEKERLFAYRNVGREAGEAVHDKLRSLILASDFRKKSAAERQGILQAIGRIASAGDIPFIESTLTRRTWFNAEAARERQWLVDGLALNDAQPAADLVARMARTGPKAVREACLKVQPPAKPAAREPAGG
jgi:hypothetical protein